MAATATTVSAMALRVQVFATALWCKDGMVSVGVEVPKAVL